MSKSAPLQPEHDGEVASLLEKIKLAVRSSSTTALDMSLLTEAQDSISRLLEIAELRRTNQQQLKLLVDRLAAWEQSHASVFDGHDDYAQKVLDQMRSAVTEGNMTADRLEKALTTLEQQLSNWQKQDQELKVLIAQTEDESGVKPGDSKESSAGPASGSVDSDTKSGTDSTSDAKGAARDSRRSESAKSGKTGEVSLQQGAGASVAEPDEGVTAERVKPSTESPPSLKKIDAADSASEDVASGEEGSGTKSEEEVRHLILSELSRGRVGIAYHLARSTVNSVPTALAMQLVAANFANDGSGVLSSVLHPLTLELNGEVESQLAGLDQPFRHEYAALLASATLWPAVVAPRGGAGVLLKTLAVGHLQETPALQRLAEVGADVSMKNNLPRLPIELLRGDVSLGLDQWRTDVHEREREIATWVERAMESTTSFAAATKVWHRMLENDERRGGHPLLGRMLSQMKEDGDLAIVRQTYDYWTRQGESEIDLIHRSMRTGPATKRIEGNARNTIVRKIKEALDMANAWIMLLESKPRDDMEYQDRLAKELRDAMERFGKNAIGEIRGLSSTIGSCCATLINRYSAHFTDQARTKTNKLTFDDVLHGDLLTESSILFDDTGCPIDDGPTVEQMLRMARSKQDGLVEAALKRSKIGDFIGAQAAIELARRKGEVEDDEAEAAEAQVDSIQEEIVQTLRKQAHEARSRIDAAHARGDITAEDADSIRGEIPRSDEVLRPVDIAEMKDTVLSIEELLVSVQERRRKETASRLEQLRDIAPGDLRRITSAIEGGRLQVAEDCIERIEDNLPLPTEVPEAERPLDEFFPSFVESYAEYRRKADGRPLEAVCKAIQNREAIGPADASALSEEEAEDAFRFLNAWLDLQRDRRDQMEKIAGFLEILGLPRRKFRKINNAQQGRFEGNVFRFETDCIADRDVVRLPAFGSSAGGHYDIVTVRNRRTPTSIMRATSIGTRREGTKIVLVAGALDVAGRMTLARESHSTKYQRTLVIDEALAVYLAMQHSHRLSAFFDCASAFTFAQPFDADAPIVPPEMFVGREVERARVVSREGDRAHLVYGGRRLGKTALLRNVASVSNDVDRRIYMDLSGTGIGVSRPTTDLWPKVAEALSGIVREQTRTKASITKSIKAWIDGREETGRRILLLIDEADDFLEAERKERYPVLSAMKQLMDDTNRGFKVVFAGLRNVQRATKDPNMPLAHLGPPVKIGPMLPETDGDAIERLIRDPLEALGYRFQSTDSVIRIAAETNYYPGLAQQFCKELLRELRDRGPGAEGPPYVIDVEVVDRVFESPETRETIRQQFRWTIRLDRRYEFLTYLIAKQGVDKEARLGVSVETIHAQALSEWPDAFESDRSFEGFEVLLDEMSGLGILRRTEDAHYAIRTRNLRMLLGNDEEIERRFVDAKSTPLPPAVEPSKFRSDIEVDGFISPSPLTASQQDKLLADVPSVALVFGTRMADMGKIGHAIHEMKYSSGGNPVRLIKASMKSVLRELDKHINSRKEGLHLVVVQQSEANRAFDTSVLLEAAKLVGRQKSTSQRVVRPVFVGGAASAWAWLEKRVGIEKNLVSRIQEVWLTSCSPGFAQRWLEDRNPAVVPSLQSATQKGFAAWPVILNESVAGQATSIEDSIGVVAKKARFMVDVWSLEPVRDVLYVLAEYSEPMTVDDLVLIAPEVLGSRELELDRVDRVLGWAARLGVVNLGENNSYCLDRAYLAGRPKNTSG